MEKRLAVLLIRFADARGIDALPWKDYDTLQKGSGFQGPRGGGATGGRRPLTDVPDTSRGDIG
ncbi:MAG: hypothetical protein D6795_05175 [Deltaproteobacteria bacterium]|nr:MAG: hypothetical protein D6795_05175 [Deltaproteobacteria bacterium]